MNPRTTPSPPFRVPGPAGHQFHSVLKATDTLRAQDSIYGIDEDYLIRSPGSPGRKRNKYPLRKHSVDLGHYSSRPLHGNNKEMQSNHRKKAGWCFGNCGSVASVAAYKSRFDDVSNCVTFIGTARTRDRKKADREREAKEAHEAKELHKAKEPHRAKESSPVMCAWYIIGRRMKR